MSAGPYSIVTLDLLENVWRVSGPGIEPRTFAGEFAMIEAAALHMQLGAAYLAGWSAGQMALAKIHREIEQTKLTTADGTVGMKRGE